MMLASGSRYPGAQPFSDDEHSRMIFFGRDGDARRLTDKILANDVVTVYARSGLGKTSLLKAGVAPLLREDNYLPLFIRVNDQHNGPFRALLMSIPGEAARQYIEYAPGRYESLWSFFKTAEFWRGDVMLTPVLILDQFEELFTLQSEEARAHFLNELSYLIRGRRPPGGAATPLEEDLSERPPRLHVVLSLREDCLGLLEDAAEHIPQILDERFRLAPLNPDAAQQAIVGPTAVSNPHLLTRPFAVDPAAVAAILNFLYLAHTPAAGQHRRYAEPLQLQLICRRVEQIADGRQRTTGTSHTVTVADLGGEAGLSETLGDFYAEAIGSLSDKRTRRAARRLCERYLISADGRRLSLEEYEIYRLVHLSGDSLTRLVTARLLRCDNRSENVYYELSHDALIEPVLAVSRAKARMMAVLGICVGIVAAIFAVSFVVGAVALIASAIAATDNAERVGMPIAACFCVFLAIPLAQYSISTLRSNSRTLQRYRQSRVLGRGVASRVDA